MLNTVNIVNIYDKDENNADIKCEMESAGDFDRWNWQFRTLKIQHQFLENFAYPTWKLHEKLFTKPFYVRNFFYPTHFSSEPTPSATNQQSLMPRKNAKGAWQRFHKFARLPYKVLLEENVFIFVLVWPRLGYVWRPSVSTRTHQSDRPTLHIVLWSASKPIWYCVNALSFAESVVHKMSNRKVQLQVTVQLRHCGSIFSSLAKFDLRTVWNFTPSVLCGQPEIISGCPQRTLGDNGFWINMDWLWNVTGW